MLFFCLFQCFEGKGYQTESKRNETFGNVIFGTNVIQRTWSGRQAINEEATRQGARQPPWAGPPPSWAPGGSPDLLLPPIYTYVPRKHHQRSQNPISTAATFCTREIPSWGLFWRSAEGAPKGSILRCSIPVTVGEMTRIVLLPLRIKRWGLYHIA